MTSETFGDCGLQETTYRPRISTPDTLTGTSWGPITYDVVMDADGDVVAYSIASLRQEEFLHLRTELGLTQARLAEVLDRSAAWVQGIEQGRNECPMYAVYALRYLSEHPDSL